MRLVAEGTGRAWRGLAMLVLVANLAAAQEDRREDDGRRAPRAASYVVVGYSELGMNLESRDYRTLMLCPPFTTLRAQVIRRGGEPRLVRSGVTVGYSVPGNTQSSSKINFWQYAEALTGKPIDKDLGLTGHGLTGVMEPQPTGDWRVTGIPLTPQPDQGELNPLQMANITVSQGDTVVARTQTVAPVSWDLRCASCHQTPGLTTEQDILRQHDRLHKTELAADAPVNCTLCHAQAYVGAAGVEGVKSLSAALHGAHAARVKPDGEQSACYACHPSGRSDSQRDVHRAKGMACDTCHGTMAGLADPKRRPWVDEPKCGGCHDKPGFRFEQADTLFRDSRGHHGVQCATCHGSPHATGPATTTEDNAQAVALQGRPGPIGTCSVCHTGRPEGRFDHRFGRG